MKTFLCLLVLSVSGCLSQARIAEIRQECEATGGKLITQWDSAGVVDAVLCAPAGVTTVPVVKREVVTVPQRVGR